MSDKEVYTFPAPVGAQRSMGTSCPKATGKSLLRIRFNVLTPSKALRAQEEAEWSEQFRSLQLAASLARECESPHNPFSIV
jgi:hypothetical protein